VVARSAGIPDDASGEPAPIIPVADRERAADLAVVEVLRVVDTDGLSRQAVEATRLAARPRGGGPLGIARALVERGSGLSERRADPEGYLRRWRDRGSLVRAAEPVRGLAAAAVTRVPPAARPAWAAVADPTDLHVRLERAIDRGVAVERGRWRPPHSRLWPALGVLQLVATIAVILGAIWIAGLLAGVGRDVTASVELPLLGAVPMPVLLLAGGVIGWWVLGRVLSAHAGWLGRRWARSVRARVEDEVRRTVSEAVGGRIGDVEAARRELALATATLRSCDGAPRRDRP
jgi:hypothetical protein